MRSGSIKVLICVAVALGIGSGFLHAQTSASSPAGSSHPSGHQDWIDGGRIADNHVIGRMIWVMKRSAKKEADLRQFLQAQQTPGNRLYHQWLSQDQFAERFGVDDSDLQVAASYLSSYGFSISKQHKSLGTIEFSGTVGQISATFKTEVHSYSKGSIQAIALAGSQQIPMPLQSTSLGMAASGGLIGTITNRNRTLTFNTSSHTYSTPGSSQNQGQSITANASDYVPNFNGVTPGDLGSLYSVPYYGSTQALKAMDGTGVSIGVIGDSNVNLQYVNNYRSTFGLPANTPSIIIDGQDPGITNDSYTAYYQLELAGATAPNANINYYTAADTDIDTGLHFALIRAVTDNNIQVLIIGEDACEAVLGPPSSGGSNNQLVQSSYELAAAQGISVISGAGNSGSESCDNAFGTATQGLAVNGWASTPWNVAVGGTDFYYGPALSATASTYAKYWGTTSNEFVNELSYIPEQPWNDSVNGINQADASYATPLNFSTGGGLSSEGLDTDTTSGPYPEPSWQKPVVPVSLSTTARVIPDVSLFSGDIANFSAFIFCTQATDCPVPSQNLSTLSFSAGGGTEASAAVFGGIMALVIQEHGIQGNPAPTLYSLYKTQPTIFNTISHGSNAVTCEIGSTNCPNGVSTISGNTLAYSATGAYSAATGMGSVNATSLVKDWTHTNTKAATIALTLVSAATGKAVTTFNHGDQININVTASGANGVPTGDVAIITTSAQPASDSLGYITLTSGEATMDTNLFPGGTYTVYAQYTGDSVYAASASHAITATVGQVTSHIDVQDSSFKNGSTVLYGSQQYISLGVYDTTDVGNPTGFMSVYDNGNGIAAVPLNDSEGYITLSNSNLSVGSHTYSFTYSGDSTYAGSSLPNAISVTVQGLASQTVLSTDSNTLSSTNGSLSLTAVVSSSTNGNIGLPPAGTVSFYNGSGGLIIGNVPVISGTLNVSPNLVPVAIATTSISGSKLVVGGNTIKAVFNPANASPYSPSTSANATVTVSSGNSANTTTTTLTTSDGASTYFDSVAQITLNISVQGGSSAPTGTVTIFSNGVELGTASSIGSGKWTYTASTNPESGLLSLEPGPNSLSAQYSGDATHAASSGTIKLTVLDNTTTPDFEMLALSVNQTVSGGTPMATFELGFVSVNAFAGNVSLTAVPPSGISCSFPNGSTVSLSSGGGLGVPVSCTESGLASGKYTVAVSGTATFAAGLSPTVTNTVLHNVSLTLVAP